ncbi:MAG: hypothetical protein IT246_09085 [Bacteroidia bacterium]|nr:hypothetical protein [Bacteroidia bacterium]MCZ2248293.1 hypothetical protein [Bacteroidia bacterium]
MNKQKHLEAIAVMVILLFSTFTASATIWRVNNNPNYTQGCNHCFSSLQAANDTSIVMAGDTIHLEASQVEYAITTINKPLVIIGPGYFLSDNAGLQKNTSAATMKRITFDTLSQGSIIKGVRIYNTGNSADIIIKTSNILIESCWIERYISFNASALHPALNNITIKKCFIGFKVNNSNNVTPISNLIISNCYIENGIFLNAVNSPTSGEILHCVIKTDGSTNRIDFSNTITAFYNNIIVNTSNSNPIQQNNNGTVNIHDNIYTGGFPTWLTGGNNVSELYSIVFPTTGSPDSILNVNPIGVCSVCYTGFPSGTETMGMFGGGDPYELSGIPNIPAIYQLASPLNILQGGTINVNISTRSND